jgi:hypothetical protein
MRNRDCITTVLPMLHLCRPHAIWMSELLGLGVFVELESVEQPNTQSNKNNAKCNEDWNHGPLVLGEIRLRCGVIVVCELDAIDHSLAIWRRECESIEFVDQNRLIGIVEWREVVEPDQPMTKGCREFERKKNTLVLGHTSTHQVGMESRSIGKPAMEQTISCQAKQA